MKAGLSVVLGMLFGLSPAFSEGFPPAPTSVWPMYQFRPDHNAVFSAPLWRANWKVKTGGRIGGALSIVGNKLFAESFDKHLYAIDARSGKVLWKAALSNIAMNAPVAASGLVFVGTGGNSILADYGDTYIEGIPSGDDVYAIAAATGAIYWTYHTVGENMPTGALAASGNTPSFLFSNGDGHLRGLNPSTGMLQFTSPMNGSASMGSLAVHDNVAFGTSTTFGKFLLKHFNDRVAMAHRTWTWAARPDGQYLWIAPHGSQDSSPTVGSGLVFVESTRYKPHEKNPQSTTWSAVVDALDERTGNLVWEYVSPPGRYSNAGSYENSIAGLYADGRLYESVIYTPAIVAFDAKTGRIIWRAPLNAPAKMSGLAYHGRFYIGDALGELYVLDAASGNIIRRFVFPGAFSTSPPVIVGKTFFIANGTTIYAAPLDKIDDGTFLP